MNRKVAMNFYFNRYGLRGSCVTQIPLRVVND